MIDHYDWAEGREAVLRFGPRSGPVVLMALPLLEEANRTRTLGVALLRLLAGTGLAGALPDLPGTGESLEPTQMLDIMRLRRGYDGVVAHLRREHPRVYGISMRSGALLDVAGAVDGRWHFAPQDGLSLRHDLSRVQQVSTGRSLADNGYHASASPSPGGAAAAGVEIAGNLLSPDFLDTLPKYSPAECCDTPLRTVRLATDPAPADLKLSGMAPWRRAEPTADPALAAQLARDIADWVRTCAA